MPQPWLKLTTPRFELYTNAGCAKANDLLHLFEMAEGAALRPLNVEHTGPDKQLRIIAFSNTEEYAPFRLKAMALGHYLQARNRDYIVLADAEPEHYYSILAYCHIKMKAFGSAKAFLEKAAESARTAEQQAENCQLLRFAAAQANGRTNLVSGKPPES